MGGRGGERGWSKVEGQLGGGGWGEAGDGGSRSHSPHKGLDSVLWNEGLVERSWLAERRRAQADFGKVWCP